MHACEYISICTSNTMKLYIFFSYLYYIVWLHCFDLLSAAICAHNPASTAASRCGSQCHRHARGEILPGKCI